MELYKSPITKVHIIQELMHFTRQGAQKNIDRLIRLGILEPKDDSKTYGRSFIYQRYTQIFSD